MSHLNHRYGRWQIVDIHQAVATFIPVIDKCCLRELRTAPQAWGGARLSHLNKTLQGTNKIPAMSVHVTEGASLAMARYGLGVAGRVLTLEEVKAEDEATAMCDHSCVVLSYKEFQI